MKKEELLLIASFYSMLIGASYGKPIFLNFLKKNCSELIAVQKTENHLLKQFQWNWGFKESGPGPKG